MKEIKFNINYYVKVKLTKRGIKILKTQHDELNKKVNGALGDFEIKYDDNGYTKFQLHDLMNRFGEYMTCCQDLVFETEIIICVK